MEDGRFKCIFCGGDLCWNNDFDMSDVTGDDNCDGGIVSFLHLYALRTFL